MAISSTLNKVQLGLRYEKGQNLDGTPKVKSAKFSGINKAVTNDALFAFASAMGEVLISFPVELKKLSDETLMDEGA
ncbi:DUF1659 domain-containing protein [Clostridium sp.]|uniref:DUF1659 domain-containing protein n=1 Tax=Clostridium sp. TaxID=1506 RepID=UPI002FC6126D